MASTMLNYPSQDCLLFFRYQNLCLYTWNNDNGSYFSPYKSGPSDKFS